MPLPTTTGDDPMQRYAAATSTSACSVSTTPTAFSVWAFLVTRRALDLDGRTSMVNSMPRPAEADDRDQQQQGQHRERAERDGQQVEATRVVGVGERHGGTRRNGRNGVRVADADRLDARRRPALGSDLERFARGRVGRAGERRARPE